MYYLFDFDGTLIDSMPFWVNTHVESLRSFGIAVPEDFVQIITPIGNTRACALAVEMGVPMTFEAYFDRIDEFLLDGYSNKIPAKPYAIETLRRLKAEGHSVNILSAGSHRYVDPCVRRLGLTELLDRVWTVEDFGCGKNETIIYKMAAERLGVPMSECVFIDDNYVAVKTGVEAGMYTVAVYDPSSAPFRAEMQQIADRYIEDLSQL